MEQISKKELNQYIILIIMFNIIENEAPGMVYTGSLNDERALYKYYGDFDGGYMIYGTSYIAEECINNVYEHTDTTTMTKDQLVKIILKEISTAEHIQEGINNIIYRAVIRLLKNMGVEHTIEDSHSNAQTRCKVLILNNPNELDDIPMVIIPNDPQLLAQQNQVEHTPDDPHRIAQRRRVE
jgi:hypothetical protein